MKKSYTQVIKQIEALKSEAERLRKQEATGVIARIREAISFYNLTAADLGLGKAPAGKRATQAAPAKRRGKGKAAKTPKPVKFRDEQGRTWGGIGKRPQWLRDALLAGKTLQDFAVQ